MQKYYVKSKNDKVYYFTISGNSFGDQVTTLFNSNGIALVHLLNHEGNHSTVSEICSIISNKISKLNL